MSITKALQRTEKEGTFPNPFYEANVVSLPKGDNNNKENYKSSS